nr:uncharacterized protein LOC123275714 isoform X2 [Equus asinus]
MYSLAGSGGQKSQIRVWAGFLPGGSEGEADSFSLLASGRCRQSLAFLGSWLHPSHLCLHCHVTFSLHLCPVSLVLGHQSLDLGPILIQRPRRAARLNSDSRPLRASWRRRTQRPYPSSYRPPVQAAGSPSTTSTSPLHCWWLWSTCLSTAPMGSSWQRMSRPCSPGCAGPKQQTRASERCRSQRTQSRMEGSFLTTAPRRSIFPAWPFLAGHVGAPKTHPPGARHRLAASAGRQSAAGALATKLGTVPGDCRDGGGRAALAGPDLASGSSHCPVHCPLLLVSAGCSSDGGLDTPLSSDTAFGGCALCAPGFVPYYRSPEEGLHTSPGPPTSPSGGQEPPRPRAATL